MIIFHLIHLIINVSLLLLIFDDAEKGDLINTDVNYTVRPEIEEIIENYKWDLGFKKYFKV